MALGLTLSALIPKNWQVDPTVLNQDPQHYADGIGIEDFFRQSAQYKRRFLLASSLLFFIGHEPHQPEPPYATFLFEDEAGDGNLVREEAIAQAFIGTGVQAVVLSACESGKAASTDLTHGLAAQLGGLGIPHVIGMRESMLDTAGILFARALCDSLARQERMDVALQAAREAITHPAEAPDVLRRETQAVGEREWLRVQWCLPALQSAVLAHPLITWDFPRQPRRATLTSDHLNTISLPPRFIGRRFDLRETTRHLAQHRQLLITGPGGQGKTALAGKLAQDLKRRGHTVLAWAARPEMTWDAFVFELIGKLTDKHKERYNHYLQKAETEEQKATLLLAYLLEQAGGRLVLFFDNLESLQDPDPRALTDETVAAWIRAAQSLKQKGLRLLLTSRWLLPDWPARDHKTLALARQVNLPRRFVYQRDRLRLVYHTLHGNGRGLNFFAAAVAGMESDEETAFLKKLAQAEAETQTDMALNAIIARLTSEARALLNRLPVYPGPVPVEGIAKIALDLPDAERLLNRLLSVSLVERQYESAWQVFQYQLPALVGAWLAARETVAITEETATLAELCLYERKGRTLGQAQIVHDALRRAGKTPEADRFALDRIVGWLNRAGLYRTLLADWLPSICESPDPATRAEALGQTGKQWHHLGADSKALPYYEVSLAIQQEIGDKAGEGTTLNNISQIYDARGDYETALAYLQRSLAIQQEIGDVAGLCATLFNMGHIHAQNNEIQEAVSAWVKVYQLAKKLNLAQALEALSNLAPRLGLPEGLEGWEMLAQRMSGGT